MERRKSEQLFERPGARSRSRLDRAEQSRSARFDQRLDAILAATNLLFAREGYHQTSMRDIAAAANVSLANLYHYIDSKERLLFLLQFRAFSGLLTLVQAQLLGVSDPSEQLRVLVHTHVQYAIENLATLKVCSHELDSLTGEAYEEVRRVRRKYFALAQSIIARVLAERDGNHQPDVRIATMSLFGAMNWIYRWYDPLRERSHTRLAAQIFTQFHAGLTLPRLEQNNAGSGKENANGATRKSGTRTRTGRAAPPQSSRHKP